MTEQEKMIIGQLYNGSDAKLIKQRQACRDILNKLNKTVQVDEVYDIVKELLSPKSQGNPKIQPPFYCDYGYNIEVGKNFFANFNNTFLDVCPIKIGDNCMFAPNVRLYTATHPLDPTERNSGLELGKPITIGNNVWLGGDCVVCPGVNIGDNVVAGAGSVITKDVEANVVVAGNPAKVIR
ncbi:MAG: sugar O-acetyltransferase, partial [Mycoplasmatales bacterium]